jgi:hypothetical protein
VSQEPDFTPAGKAWATRRARGDTGREAALKAVATRQQRERQTRRVGTRRTRRPDAEAILGGLKDFQCRTVDYVFERMYAASEPTTRFLVADEVGLGKTLVARGVIAKAVDALWKDVRRIDVVYICSNADIARQNIRRLNVLEDEGFALASRITLLPTQIQDLKHRRINFVSFTPRTSARPGPRCRGCGRRARSARAWSRSAPPSGPTSPGPRRPVSARGGLQPAAR